MSESSEVKEVEGAGSGQQGQRQGADEIESVGLAERAEHQKAHGADRQKQFRRDGQEIWSD